MPYLHLRTILRQRNGHLFVFFADSREKNLLSKFAPNCGCTRQRCSMSAAFSMLPGRYTFRMIMIDYIGNG